MDNSLESYNLINFLKVIDLSILNLIDYVEINESNVLVLDDDKLILSLNGNSKKLLEGFIINNINNETYYGKHNILVNTCKPQSNWRNFKKDIKLQRVVAKDSSIFIDMVKLNSFVNDMFKKLPTLTAVFSKKNNYFGVSKSKVSIQKDLKLLEFKEIDQIDAYVLLTKILSSFGNVNKDSTNYNIICDGNLKCYHENDSTELSDYLFDKVRLTLIKEGII